jgi:hypothetical protein
MHHNSLTINYKSTSLYIRQSENYTYSVFNQCAEIDIRLELW